MKLQQDHEYIGKTSQFPVDSISQSEKNKPDYFLNCANAIISKYVNNKTAIPYSSGEGRYSIDDLRAFLRGTNSSNKYKNKLCRKDPNTGNRVVAMNISWNPPQILAQKMDVVKGYIMKLAYDVTTQAIDMEAKFDKDMIEANLKLMVDDRMQLLGVELNEAAGRNIVEPQQQGQEIPFQSEKEVAMFSQIGGILLEQEIAIKILLDETLMCSDWEGIKDKLVEDLLSLGWCATKSYVEKGSDIPKRRWVDLARVICPYSEYNDHRDGTFGGEIRSTTIAEIRKESNLSNQEILKIARQYSRDEKTSQHISRGFYEQATLGDSFGMNMIDSIVVDIADLCWIGTKSDSFTRITRKKEGNLAINKVEDDFEVSEADKKRGKEKTTYSRQCVYKAKLIIGTNHVYDYGEEYNQSYRTNSDGKQEIIFPYRFVKTGSTSLVERCIGFYDDIAMATYKKRNAINKIIPPPGLFIEQSAFENVELGGNKVGAKENMRMLGETGFAVGNTQNLWGTNVAGRNPINQIPAGANEQIRIFNEEIEFNIRQIERVTGINEIFSGATPSSETGLGVSKIAVNATTNAIFPLLRTLETCHEQALRVEAKQWQVSAATMDDKKRSRMAHDRALGYVKIGKSLSYREFLIKIEAGATEEEKLQLLTDIRQLQDLRRQGGSGGIRPSDYILIEQMIRAGQIKQARLVLASVEEHIQKLDDARNEQNQQFNIESQMQSNQQTADNEMKIIEAEEGLKTQREMQLENMKIQGELMKQRQKGIDDRKLAAVQNVYGWGMSEYNQKPK